MGNDEDEENTDIYFSNNIMRLISKSNQGNTKGIMAFY